jgi:hypothetical protein
MLTPDLRLRVAVLSLTVTLLGLVPLALVPAAAQEPPPAPPPVDPASSIAEVSIDPESITSLVGETATAVIARTSGGQPQAGAVRVHVEYVSGEQPPASTTPGGPPTRMPRLVRQGPPPGDATLQSGDTGNVDFELNAVLPGRYSVVACPVVPPGGQARCDQATVTFGSALVAVLNGNNEIGSNGARGAGDPDGVGVAFLSPTDDNRLCYGVVVEGITLPSAAAHVHAGGPAVNGPITQTLIAPAEGGVVFGCAQLSDPATRPAFSERPGEFYVNVHTPDRPDGALRGTVAPW